MSAISKHKSKFDTRIGAGKKFTMKSLKDDNRGKSNRPDIEKSLKQKSQTNSAERQTEPSQPELTSSTNERILKLLAENITDVVFVYYLDKHLAYVSPSFEKLTGYTCEELYAQNFISYIHPEDEEQMTSLWDDLFQGKLFPETEFRIITKTGEVKWCLSSWGPLMDETGRQIGIRGREADITEHKQARLKLIESEKRYRNLFMNTHDAILIADDTGHYVDVNPSACDLLGYTQAELLTMGVADLTSEAWKTFLAAGHQSSEYLIRCKSGVERLFDFHAVANFMPGMHLSVLRDITEKKRIETKRRENETALQTFINALPEPAILIDLHYQIISANQAMASNLNWQLEDLIGKHMFEILPYELAHTWQAQIEQVINTATLVTYEDSRADRHFINYISPDVQVPGKVSKVAIMAFDITDRKHAEEQVQQAEAKYRDIFENAVEGIFQSTPDGRFLNVNTAMAHLYGYDSPEDMINTVGNQIEAKLYTRPSRRAEFIRLLEQDGSVKQFEDDNYRKDGSIAWTRTSARAIRDENGITQYYEGFMQDITERKQIELELINVNKKLMEMHKTLREQATHDSLTSLYNRRHLNEYLERKLMRAQGEHRTISVLMIDIDKFKDFNDTYGHNFGDEILRTLSSVLQHNIRESDSAYRYGGDEFIVLMPGAAVEEAARRAETICHDFSRLPIRYEALEVSTAISIGVSAFPLHGQTGDEIIRAADAALYQAKQAGRNQISVWQGAK